MALLTTIFALTYAVNMVVAEMYFDEVGDLLAFILLKYCFGTLHHLFSPLAVLVSYPEVASLFFSDISVRFLLSLLFNIYLCTRFVGQRCERTTEGEAASSRPRSSQQRRWL